MGTPLTIVLGLLLLIAAAAIIALVLRLRQMAQQHAQLSQQQAQFAAEDAELKSRYQGILDVEAEKARVLGELEAQRTKLQEEIAKMRTGAQKWVQEFREQKARMEQEATAQKAHMEQEFAQQRQQRERELAGARAEADDQITALATKLTALHAELDVLEEAAEMQSVGFYKPRYNFATSQRYQTELDAIRARQKQMIKAEFAAFGMIEWVVNGSKTEGRKQIKQTLKLMLRAFNGECDAAVAKVKYNNVQVMAERIRKAQEAISKLAQVQQCFIHPDYMDLKLEELHLVHEFEEKVQAEKEEQRRIREQMREEEIAQREIERAQQEAEKEEARYAAALIKARAEAELAAGARQEKLRGQVEELERRLAEAQANRERAIARAQMTRSGHVYVISNRVLVKAGRESFHGQRPPFLATVDILTVFITLVKGF